MAAHLANYCLAARLEGSQRPINCLAFSRNGALLASGGDDETVRIWDMKTYRRQQVIRDSISRWGQITCAKWFSGEGGDGTTTLCFGTGRGMIQIYHRTRSGGPLLELSSTRAFAVSDSVEAFAHDAKNSRLVITSHFGKIKMFSVEKNGTLIQLWTKEMGEQIPRSVHFVDGYQNVYIFGLETGEICSKVAETGRDNWSKTLNSVIGDANISPNEQYLLVENLGNGYDLYDLPQISPSRSFAVPNSRKFTKKGTFTEKSTTVVCGSDHGLVYVFSVGSSECVQTLRHARKDVMIQVVDAISTAGRHLVASGSSEELSSIHIWEKKVGDGLDKKHKGMAIEKSINITNVMMFMLLLWCTWESWTGHLAQVQTMLSVTGRNLLSTGLTTHRIQWDGSDQRAIERIFETELEINAKRYRDILERHKLERERERQWMEKEELEKSEVEEHVDTSGLS